MISLRYLSPAFPLEVQTMSHEKRVQTVNGWAMLAVNILLFFAASASGGRVHFLRRRSG